MMFSFSDKAQIILSNMGWFVERRVDPSNSIREIEGEGYFVFDIAISILEHLGGLNPYEIPEELMKKRRYLLKDGTQIYFPFYPLIDFVAEDAPHVGLAEFWKTQHYIRQERLRLFPIGSIQNVSTLFVVSDGRIFSGESRKLSTGERRATLLFLGEDIGRAINRLVEQHTTYL